MATEAGLSPSTSSTSTDTSCIYDLLKTNCQYLNENQLTLLIDRLKCVGVLTETDLSFVTESDLLDINIMSIIQARKVFMFLSSLCLTKPDGIRSNVDVTSACGSSVNLTGVYPPSNSPNTSYSSYSTNESDRDNNSVSETIYSSPGNWLSSYDIPWDRLPKTFKASCNMNRIPSQSDVREVIRILVDDILDVCKRPSSRDIYVIAAKLVDTYRTSLLDRVGDRIIGTGYSSWINKIQDRINNVNRKNSSVSEMEEGRKRKSCYGHIVDLDLEDYTCEEATSSKEYLLRQVGREDVDYTLITETMDKTFNLRQKEISSMTVKDIQENWPFIFVKMCSLKDFERLTGINLSREFKVNSSKTKQTVLAYMKTHRKTNLAIGEIWNQVDEFQSISDKMYPESLLLVRLLLAFFKEDGLVEYHPKSSDRKAVEEFRRLEGAPIIAVVGNLYESPIFHIIIESKSVQTYQTLDDALLVVFAMYYIMNLRYLKS